MPPLIPNPVTAASVIRASASTASWVALPTQIAASASFSTTASREKFTKARRQFRDWERHEGRLLRRPNPGQTQYLSSTKGTESNRPFPLNPYFRSSNVLSESSRELIWEKIMRGGETIKAVSVEYGVDLRRVAAIVRLKEVEKDWIAKGKQLAKPYARAVLGMLPTHQIRPLQANPPFESVNEIHVHPYTMQQIFWPTSESRHFTREDAAKAFHPTLLSADKRVPHPELIQMEKDVLDGMAPYEATERFKKAVTESEQAAAKKQLAKAAYEERRTTRVHTDRFEFRFKTYNAEEVGRRGKSRKAVGWRYGAPYDDRSKAQELKIPTTVP